MTASVTEFMTPAWQGIASGPKDGTSVLLWCEAWLTPIVGHWSVLRMTWLEDGTNDPDANIATHWMPLPLVPSTESKSQQIPDEKDHDQSCQQARQDLRDALMQAISPRPTLTHRWAKNGHCTECGCYYAGFERKDPCPKSEYNK